MAARICVSLVVLLLSVGSTLFAAPSYQDVSAAAKLNFFNSYGTVYPTAGGSIYVRNMGNGAAVGDYDNDGDLDIYILGMMSHANRLFRNDLDLSVKEFTETTGTAGVAEYGVSRVAHFTDLDDDGWLDLLVVNDDDGTGSAMPSRIFRNNADGTFTDVTAGSGFRPIGYLRCGVALADYDRDGLLDIYVTNWGLELGGGSPGFPGRNELYRNLGNFVFEQVTDQVGLGTLSRDSFTAIFADFEADSHPDLFVAVDHTTDEFFMNQGGLFANATAATNVTHQGNDMGVACADIDNDGDLDLYATNIRDPDFFFGNAPQTNALHINGQETSGVVSFVDEAVARGVEDTFWGWGTEFTDIENDGDLDLIAVTGFDEYVTLAGIPGSALVDTPTISFINDSTANFSRITGIGLDDTYDSRGLTAFDYDRDGDEDLLVTNINEPAILYENTSTNQGHWLGVTLQQLPGNNINGVGATVYATVGSATYRRDFIVGDSYLSGNPAEVHFGLGNATLVDQLTVRWTDGMQTDYPNVAVDQWLQLTQPFVDADNDTVHDGHDCAPADPASWRLPETVSDLLLSGGANTQLDWSVGDTGASIWNADLLRATDPSALGSASCLTVDPGGASATDSTAPGNLFVYLVRINNACGSALGRDWQNRPRAAPTCP